MQIFGGEQAYVGCNEVRNVGVLSTVVFLQRTANSAVEPAMVSNAGEVDSICALACLGRQGHGLFPLAIGAWG